MEMQSYVWEMQSIIFLYFKFKHPLADEFMFMMWFFWESMGNESEKPNTHLLWTFIHSIILTCQVLHHPDSNDSLLVFIVLQ